MSNNFIKFKGKLLKIRVMKSLLLGAACGFCAGGVWLMLSRLAIIPFEPITALLVGGFLLLLGVGVGWLVFRTTDISLAKKLDADFALHEKTQTMVAYKDGDSEMLLLQRQDTEEALSEIPLSRFKDKLFFIYPIVAALGAAVLISAFLVPDMRNYEPPEYVKPFAISEFQIAGIEELIKYTESSKANEDLREAVVDELESLLDELKAVDTEPEMQAALAESMAILCDLAYDASSMTEIATSLWSSGDKTVKEIAKTINTSDWREPEWGAFAEGFAQLRLLFNHQSEGGAEGDEEIMLSETRWLLENTALKLNMELSMSQIDEGDPLYDVIIRFAGGELDDGGDKVYGLGGVAEKMANGSYADGMSELDRTFNAMADDIYAVLAAQKNDTNAVEYVMTRLSELFFVPLPRFERPSLTEHGDGGTESDDNDKDGPSDGGMGEGEVFGSKDLILNPETGEYVEYGTIIDEYYAVMYEKIQNGVYTEEQAEIIKNYFAILYGGMENEEGN